MSDDKYRKMLEEVQRRIKEDELEQLNYEIARKRNKKLKKLLK
jgi:glycine betaine/choline ABC-type transport system substrate-binding protein